MKDIPRQQIESISLKKILVAGRGMWFLTPDI